MRRLSLFTISCLAGLALVAIPFLDTAASVNLDLGTKAYAQAATKGPSGLPLPRFVSLKAKRVNLRVGPGQNYAVAWLYTKSGVPMEVIQEYDNWRRVRDAEGTEGWVYQSLLSGERTAVTAPWEIGSKNQGKLINMYREARANSNVLARLEPGVMVSVKKCTGQWCEAKAADDKGRITGWVAQTKIWGAYPGEAFN